jgi:hypothetical protein
VLDVDLRVAQALDEVVPRYHERGDWEAVKRAARRDAPRRAAAALAIAAAAVLALAWPFAGQRAGVLERALAAVGDGPVVHAIFRAGTGQIDEVWYEPGRGLLRMARDGRPREYFPWSNDRPEFPWANDDSPEGFALFLRVTGLAESYRNALESGRARVLGEDELDGVRVHWIDGGTVWRLDGADVRDVWGLHVAVSRETYRPVAVRMTRDGEQWPSGTARILLFETLPEGAFPVEGRPAPP